MIRFLAMKEDYQSNGAAVPVECGPKYGTVELKPEVRCERIVTGYGEAKFDGRTDRAGIRSLNERSLATRIARSASHPLRIACNAKLHRYPDPRPAESTPITGPIELRSLVHQAESNR